MKLQRGLAGSQAQDSVSELVVPKHSMAVLIRVTCTMQHSGSSTFQACIKQAPGNAQMPVMLSEHCRGTSRSAVAGHVTACLQPLRAIELAQKWSMARDANRVKAQWLHTGSMVGGVVDKDPVHVIAVLVEVPHFLDATRPHVQGHLHAQILSAGIQLVIGCAVLVPGTQQPCCSVGSQAPSSTLSQGQSTPQHFLLMRKP